MNLIFSERLLLFEYFCVFARDDDDLEFGVNTRLVWRTLPVVAVSERFCHTGSFWLLRVLGNVEYLLLSVCDFGVSELLVLGS